MDRRFIAFMFLAFGILLANATLVAWLDPPQPAEEQVAEEGAADQADPAAGEEPDATPEEPKDEAPSTTETAESPAEGDEAEEPEPQDDVAEEAEKEFGPQWATLGSVDPTDNFKMLVTLTSRGAAVERVELSEDSYRDLDDRSGYLGHLELGIPEQGSGAVVRVVGRGTPAAKAGLKVGDVITHIDGQTVAGPAGFLDALKATKPGQEVTLRVLHGDDPSELTATLIRKPLEIIAPESTDLHPEDALSLRLALASVDGKQKPEDGELFDVSLLEGNWELTIEEPEHVAFRRRVPGAGLELIKHYRLEPTIGELGFDFNFEIEVANIGKKPVTMAYLLDGPNGLPREGGWYAQKMGRQWGQVGLRDVVVALDQPDRDYPERAAVRCLDIIEDEQKLWTLPLEYIGVDGQYFSTVLIPQKENQQDRWIDTSTAVRVGPIPKTKKERNLTNVSFQLTSKPITLEPNQHVKHDYLMFAGPKKPEVVDTYGLGWLIYYGWFSPVSKVLLVLLHFYATYFTFGNYGLAIILLTVTVRMCMFPLSRKQVMGMQKMQELQPEMKKIQEKYKSEPEKRMKAQQELFRKANYNPFSGCLPVLIQMPIFIGLYRALLSDVELRQAPLISENIRWASNLAAPDMFFNWSHIMPNIVVSTLGPYLNILPLVTVALFLWQQKMFMPPPTDEQQELQQKIMKFMMIIMAFFFFKVPSGLCIYFISSSLWGILERKLLPKVTAQTDAAGTAGAGQTPTKSAAANRSSGSNGSAERNKRRKQKRR